MGFQKRSCLLAVFGLLAAVTFAGCSGGNRSSQGTTQSESTAALQETVEYSVTSYPGGGKEENIAERVKLTAGAEYFYDLDFDGTEEKIFYTVEQINEYDEKPRLFVNDVEVSFTMSTGDYLSGELYLMDIDGTDAKLELYADWRGSSDTLSLNQYFHYENGAVTVVADMSGKAVWEGKGAITRIGGVDQTENGKIRLWVDTPFYSETIGCYFVGISFEMTDGRLLEVPENEYEIRATDPVYQYQALTSFVTTAAPGTAALAFPVEVDEFIAIDRIAFVGADMYARAVNISGQLGWFLLGDTLFAEIPQWG